MGESGFYQFLYVEMRAQWCEEFAGEMRTIVC